MKTRHWSEWFLGAGLVLLSISHWFPLGINLLELAGAFAHLTVALCLIGFVVSALLHLKIMTISSLLSLAISGALVIPHFLPANYSGEPDFTIGQFNLYHHNPTPKSAINTIVETTPDIFTIQEQNAEWSTITDSVFASTHPYTVEAPMETCCYGIGLFSKFPIVNYNVLDLEGVPVIVAQIKILDELLTVVSLHTRPPVFPNETAERNEQLMAVADIISSESGNCVAIGDFNIVPWESTFKKFLVDGGLKSVRNGFQATYPMYLNLPLIPIDHITYSGEMHPTLSNAIAIAGSDHKGLVAGFAFAD